MDDEVAAKIKVIADFANSLPEQLQVRAFELLVGDYLAERHARRAPVAPLSGEVGKDTEPKKTEPPDVHSKTGDDLQLSDVHLKVRKFLDKHQLSLDDLNQIFYKQAGQVTPLYEDLKTTKLGTMQVRLALLMALQNAVASGGFTVNGEEVREACRVRKCYDMANYSKNFAGNAAYFEGFDRYSKDSPALRLSEEGKEALAELIKELR